MKKLIVLILLVGLQSCADKKKDIISEELSDTLEVNTEAPVIKTNARVPALNFEELTPLLTKDNDTTYVINFWATWCKPCIKELPAFEQLNKVYADKKVKVVLVSLDFADKIETQVIPFMDREDIQSQVVLLDDGDANSWIPKVSSEWSGAIPATLIYKKDTRKFYEKSFTYPELEKEVKSIL